MKLFDMDGPVQKYGSIVFDVLAANALWLLISVFSVGILQGPALTGLYAGSYAGIVTSKGYTFKEFFMIFKKRFLPSLGVWGLQVIATAVLFVDLTYTSLGLLPSYFTYLMPLFMFMALETLLITTVAYPLLANTKLSIKEVLKYSFLMAHKHLGFTFLAAIPNAIMTAIIVLIFAFQAVVLFPALFFLMGIIACANSYLITGKVITRYNIYREPDNFE